MHPYLEGPYPRAFAHRGWHIDRFAGLENALSGFQHAFKEGFRYLETDVHATSDGIVVMHHDASLQRTTDGRGVIAELPWSAVRTARIAGIEPVMPLENLLEELPEAFVNVDVKANAAIGPVVQLLERMNCWDRICLGAFSQPRLEQIRRQCGPRLLTALARRSAFALAGKALLPAVLGDRLRVTGELAQLPAKRGPITTVTRRLVDTAHRLGREIHVWTVDQPERMRHFLDLGVDGLVTNRPDVLRDILRERGQWHEQP